MSTLADFSMPAPMRAAITALCPIVCPEQQIDEHDLTPAIVEGAELFLRSLATEGRAAVTAGTIAFELGAAVRPSTLGKRFSALSREQARAYFDSWWHSKNPALHNYAKGVKSMLALAFYEQPVVRDRLRYDPDGWINRVARERVVRWADAIRQHEALLHAPAPLVGKDGAPASAPSADEAAAPSVEPVSPPPRGGSATERGVPERVYTRDHWPDVDGRVAKRERWWGGYEIELAADVVIIGSGAGGGVMAAELAEGGLDVLVIEEGGYHRTEEFTGDNAAMVRKLYRDGGLTMALGRPPVLLSEGKCVGGSTTINGGMSWRTPDPILERWQREDGLTDATPEAMDRYFSRVEAFISARHNDPETLGRDNALLKEGADKKGWRIIPNIRNQVHCAGSNNCAFGCPTGAKQSTLVSYLPRARRFGARLYSDCRVDKLLFEGSRVRGVSGRVIEANGKPSYHFVARAPLVVVCCGALQTPALLSRSGLRSPSGQIGKNLALHPNCKVVALFDEEVESYKGAHQFYQVREFQREGIGVLTAINVPPAIVGMSVPMYGEELGALMDQYQRMVVAGCLLEDSVTGQVRVGPGGNPVAFYQLARRDADLAVRAVELLSELMFTAGAKRLILPFEGVPELHGPDDIRWLRNHRVPRESMELMTVHMMGTCRMGADRERHVCDPRGRFYGTEGLYIADASVFPSPIGVNPMETVMALATRTAEHILQDHGR